MFVCVCFVVSVAFVGSYAAGDYKTMITLSLRSATDDKIPVQLF